MLMKMMKRGDRSFYKFLSVFMAAVLILAMFPVSFTQADEPEQQNMYYVSQSGNDDWSGRLAEPNGDGTDGPFKTIAKANHVAQAGDTVIIRGGAYEDTIRPYNTGEENNPITYKNFGGETVIIKGLRVEDLLPEEYDIIETDPYGIYIYGKSYIVIEGIQIDFEGMQTNGGSYWGRWGRVVNSGHITLNNVAFKNCMVEGTSGGICFINSHYNTITGCTLDDGNDLLVLVQSDYNLVENCTFTKGRHTLWCIRAGSYNILRNNYFHNKLQKIGEIYDNGSYSAKKYGTLEQDAAKYNIVENNIFAYTPHGDDGPYNGIQFAGQSCIIRNNIFYDNYGGGLGMALYEDEAYYNYNNRVYNNTFVNNQGGGISVPRKSSMAPDYFFYKNIFKNNIISNNIYTEEGNRHNYADWVALRGKPVQIWGIRWDGHIMQNNVIYSSDPDYSIAFGDNSEHHSVAWMEQNFSHLYKKNIYNIEPEFVQIDTEYDPTVPFSAEHNFELADGSPLIDRGEFLTTVLPLMVNGSEGPTSGKSSVIAVEDPLYFTDGFGIVEGDTVKLQNGETAVITDIVYGIRHNRITLDREVNWSKGMGISLYYEGTAPDMGAVEKAEAEIPETPVNTPTEFITSVNLASNRWNDGEDWRGMKITVADKDIVVTQLGRWVMGEWVDGNGNTMPGNTQVHPMKIVDVETEEDVANSLVEVATADAPAEAFKYAELAQPVTLSAGKSYYIVSREFQDGDYWYASATEVQYTPDATVNGWARYSFSNSQQKYKWYDGSGSNSIGPVSFIYMIPGESTEPTPTPTPTGAPQQYTLTVNSENGYVIKDPNKDYYESGEKVRLISRPATGYNFESWGGDASGSRLIADLVMDGNKTVTANFESWTAPVGISEPEFGIHETYRMYDDSANRNSALTYYQNAEGGYYTHYVDNTNTNATDTNNPYGTAEKPRKTLPKASDVPAGSVIEIHGGPYTLSYTIYTVNGTASQPIFLRGYSDTDRPVFTYGDFYVNSQYLIIENIKRTDKGIIVRSFKDRQLAHHVAVRNCEVQYAKSGISAVSYDNGYPATDIVIYNNHVHLDNFDPADGNFPEDDEGAVGFNKNSERVWVLDNYFHHIKGDAVGGGHGVNYTAKNYYVGRNIMHTCGENAVDIKEVDTVILSKNIMYNFRGWSDGSGSGHIGTAVVFHYGPNYSPMNVWFMYNEMFDCDLGIQVGGDQIHPVYIIGNIVHDVKDDRGTGTGYGFRTWSCREVFMTGNVFYNVDNGVDWVTNISAGWLVFEDNIISNVTQGGYHLRVEATEQQQKAVLDNNLFYQPEGDVRIVWGTSEPVYNVAQWQAATGKGSGCIEANPLFVDPQNQNFRLQSGSPAIDMTNEHDLYQLFFNTYARDIRYDMDGVSRPQGSAWDIGAYEYPEGSVLPSPTPTPTATPTPTLAPIPPIEFVTGANVQGVTAWNDADNWYGMSITVGDRDIKVLKLGRWVLGAEGTRPRNTGTHQMKIVIPTADKKGQDVAGSTVNVNTSSVEPGQFAYADLNDPITLSANTTYYIASLEVNGGDYWYGSATTVSHTADATVNSIAKTYKGNWETPGSAGSCMVPVSFVYSIEPKPTPAESGVTAIWMVRHAERQDTVDPNWGETAPYIDDPELSANGIIQAEECAQALKDENISHIFSSPFLRTIQTASEIAYVLNLQIKAEEGLSEWLRNDWYNSVPTVMPIEDKMALYPIDPSYTSLGSAVYPETDNEFKARVTETLNAILEQYSGEILLAGHGGSLSVAAEALVGSNMVNTELCCIIKIVRDGDRWVVERDGS